MLADDLDHISIQKFCMNKAVPSLLEGNSGFFGIGYFSDRLRQP
jgi:hypothetical protein